MKDLLAVIKQNIDDTNRRFEDMNKKIEERFDKLESTIR